PGSDAGRFRRRARRRSGGARPRQARAETGRCSGGERHLRSVDRIRVRPERSHDRDRGWPPPGAARPEDSRSGCHRGRGGRAAQQDGRTGMTPEERADKVYDLFKRGSELLEHGDFSAAAIPLEKAREMEPEKSSIREALGRAYFRTGRYAAAAGEFQAVVDRYP